MIRHLGNAYATLNSTYSLSFSGCKSEIAGMDWFIPAYILVLLRTKLSDPRALYKYVHTLSTSIHDAGLQEQLCTNFISCNDFLLDMKPESLKLTAEEQLRQQRQDSML